MRATSVCRELDLSYRQLDYLRRTGLLPMTGSGNPHQLSDDTVLRLTAAKALSRASGERTWPRMAAACLSGPTPLPRGWACLAGDGTLAYGADIASVMEALGRGAIVAEYGTLDATTTAA